MVPTRCYACLPNAPSPGTGNGNQGFTFALPDQLLDGQTHTLSLKTPGRGFQLFGSPQQLSCTRPTSLQGVMDPINLTQISGWAWERNNAATQTAVTIYDGATPVANATASQYRSDLSQIGIGNAY